MPWFFLVLVNELELPSCGAEPMNDLTASE